MTGCGLILPAARILRGFLIKRGNESAVSAYRHSSVGRTFVRRALGWVHRDDYDHQQLGRVAMIARSLIATILCVVIAGYGARLVFGGLRTGETKWPRIVGMDVATYHRKKHPLKFSAAIAVISISTTLFLIGAALLIIRIYYIGSF